MEDLIYGTGLSLINTGNKPTFETRRGSLIMDLTLTSPALATHVRQWHVEDEMHLSAHHQISCVVRKGRNLKKVNWTEFGSHLEETFATYEIPNMWSTQTIETAKNDIHTAINAALDVRAPIGDSRSAITQFRVPSTGSTVKLPEQKK
jgi:hypothetical protein